MIKGLYEYLWYKYCGEREIADDDWNDFYDIAKENSDQFLRWAFEWYDLTKIEEVEQ